MIRNAFRKENEKASSVATPSLGRLGGSGGATGNALKRVLGFRRSTRKEEEKREGKMHSQSVRDMVFIHSSHQ